MLSLPVMDKLKMAKATAAMLLEIEAVHVNARAPFILTSGAASPVYIDCRKLISFVRIRSALMGFAASVLAEDAGFEAFDSVAGGETAGIPFAAFLAERLALPMQKTKRVWPQCANRGRFARGISCIASGGFGNRWR